MRKLNFFIVAAFCLCFVGGSVYQNKITVCAEENEYYIGGMTAGFLLSAGGTEVMDLSDVCTKEGLKRPAEEAGLKIGDRIVAVNGESVQNVKELNRAINKSGGKNVELKIIRNGAACFIQITPVKEKQSKAYKIGVLIRDTLSGVGTVTYVRKSDRHFAALGHNLTDENNQPLLISETKVYACSIIGVNKGKRGQAGELRGLFMNEKPVAKAEYVCNTGLYGVFQDDYDLSQLPTTQIAPISEATIGKAIIYSTIDGVSPQEYEISIAKVDASQKDNKNFVIKVTDERLISETGGIVQGMSGSPIIQNGKLIGAVTHVFINDPTRGYGIGIEKMIN